MGTSQTQISQELWQNILVNLPDDNYGRVQLVCSSWRGIINQPIFWKLRCLKEWGNDIVPNKIETSANTTGVLNFDKDRYFIPTITDPNGRTKIDWQRYYNIRAKIEWIVNNWASEDEDYGSEEEKEEKGQRKQKSVELDLTTFDLEEFLSTRLPPGQTGYDKEKNTSVYLLLDLIALFHTHANKKNMFMLTRKLDSWVLSFVPDHPTRLLEAHWKLCKTALEQGSDQAQESAFSMLHAVCFGTRDFNPRAQQVLKEVMAIMIDQGEEDDNAKIVMRTIFPSAFEKQNRKQNEKGYLEFHEVLYKLASEVFYGPNSTITQRKNAIIALLATGSPMIPDYIHRVVKLLIDGMKSTEPIIIQKSFDFLCGLANKGHKLTAEQTKEIIELAKQHEKRINLRYICFVITPETSHVIDDNQLDWLNRIQLARAGKKFEIHQGSLGKLRAAFGSRIDKYVPQYRSTLMNKSYWSELKEFDPETEIHDDIVREYLKLIEPQNGEDPSEEFKAVLANIMSGQDLPFNVVHLVLLYFPMVNLVYPCDKEENQTMWRTAINGILSLFSEDVKKFGAAQDIFADLGKKDEPFEYNEENILSLKDESSTRNKEARELIEDVLRVREFKTNTDLVPLSTENEMAMDWGPVEQEVVNNIGIIIPAFEVLSKLAKQMQRRFDPYVIDTMHLFVAVSRLYPARRISEATYKIIAEFFSENFVPVASEKHSLIVVKKYQNMFSLDREDRGIVKSDLFLESLQSLAENMFKSIIMNSRVTPYILSCFLRELCNWPTERVPLLIDILITTRPSLAYETFDQSRTALYGFAAWIEKFGEDEIALKTYVIIATQFGISFTDSFRTELNRDRLYSLEETRRLCLDLKIRSTNNHMIKLLNKLIMLLSCCMINRKIEDYNQIKIHWKLNKKSEDKPERDNALMTQAKYSALIEDALKSTEFDTECEELNELVRKSDKSFAFFLSLDNNLNS